MTFLLSGRMSSVDNAGMANTFRPYEPDQLLLLPPSLADWVPEDHLARFVSDVVDALDLTAIEEAYGEERGYPPYHPRMMVKVHGPILDYSSAEVVKSGAVKARCSAMFSASYGFIWKRSRV